MNNTSKTTRALVEGALMVAAAEALGYIKLWHMPEGGSISLMMLPIVLYALRWGLRDGLLAGCALGIIDFMLGGGIAIGWQSILGDYVIACTLIGLAGVGHKHGTAGVIYGSIVGCLGRYAAVWVTGATIWGEYMPEEFFGMTMHTPWFYSLLYNLAYMLPNIAICLLVFALLNKPLGKYFRGEDLRA